MGKGSFVLYTSWEEQLVLLNDEERGRLLLSLFAYEKTRTIPSLSPAAMMAFMFIKAQMDRDDEKYSNVVKRNQENGRSGGRPKSTENNSGNEPKVEVKEEEIDQAPVETQETEPVILEVVKPKKPSGFLENPKNPEEPKKPDNDYVYDYEYDYDSLSPPTSPKTENTVVLAYWELCSSLLPLPRDDLTKYRERQTNKLLSVYTIEQIREAFQRFNASEFCKGGGSKGWMADFDFCIRPSSITKALKGSYDGLSAKTRTKELVKRKYGDLVE